MIAIAQEKAECTGLPVSFHTGDVRKLPFSDARFDAVLIERTLQILDTPGKVIDERVGVIRPGGRLVAIEREWETFVCDSGSRDMARTFFRFCADQFPDGSTGRTLYRYFRDRCLADMAIHADPFVLHDFSLAAKMMNMVQFLSAAQEKAVLSRDEVDTWHQELKAADAKGLFTFAGMMFAVAGRK